MKRSAFRWLVVVSVALVAAVLGCGVDVATCSDVCPTGSSGDTCAASCSSLQSQCQGSAQGSADFQALLTCVANLAEALTPLPTLCEPQYQAAQASCTGAVAVDAH